MLQQATWLVGLVVSTVSIAVSHVLLHVAVNHVGIGGLADSWEHCLWLCMICGLQGTEAGL